MSNSVRLIKLPDSNERVSEKAGTVQFYLPSYSPELNPDEYLNCDLKAGVHSGMPARSKDQLKSKAMSHLRRLQNLPKRVAKYFEAQSIQYAKA